MSPRTSWPGARRVPDDMRRAITTTGLTPGMAPFTLGLILGGIWRQQRQPKVMIEWTADMPRKARRRLVLLHCLDRDAADLIGRNRYAASSKGGPHKASVPQIRAC